MHPYLMNKNTLFNRAAANDLLRKIAEAPHRTGYREAIWTRDLLLISWVLFYPERLAELFRITWKSDNTGHLFKDAGGNWTYHNIHAGDAIKNSAYVIARPVSVLIGPYLDAREALLKRESDSFFYMPSNHMQHRINTLIEFHFGREVTFSELRSIEKAC
jgi:hypothetical protein